MTDFGGLESMWKEAKHFYRIPQVNPEETQGT